MTCVCLFKGCLALRNTHKHEWKGGGERGGEQMAKHSPFPCGLDSKPVQSVGTPLGPGACRVSTSEQTKIDAKVSNP